MECSELACEIPAIQELNIRETLTWYDFKISNDGWINDTDLFKSLDTKLGAGYHWKIFNRQASAK